MVLQAVVRGGGHRPCVPPSNLPPLGGGEESVHTAVDHNEGGSFEEIALASLRWGPMRGLLLEQIIDCHAPPRHGWFCICNGSAPEEYRMLRIAGLIGLDDVLVQ